MNLKQYKYIFVFIISLSILTGCGSSSNSTPTKDEVLTGTKIQGVAVDDLIVNGIEPLAN